MLTDEQAKELVPKTICGLEVKLPRVYVAWVNATIAYYDSANRRIPNCTDAELAAKRKKMDELRSQMRRLEGLPT